MRAPILLSLAAITMSRAALAAPYAEPSERRLLPGVPYRPGPGRILVVDPAAQLDRVAAFELGMQCTDPMMGVECVGGVIECEAPPCSTIIQSDNTQEAVWIWSTHQRLTGHDHSAELARAWIYL